MYSWFCSYKPTLLQRKKKKNTMINGYQTFYGVFSGDTVLIDNSKDAAACYSQYNGIPAYREINPDHLIENYNKKYNKQKKQF